MTTIASVVEGHGETKALPHLLRRIGGELLGRWDVRIPTPFRLDSGKMMKPDELSRAVRFQAARVQDDGGVLVLRDGDDAECPVELATGLLDRAGPITCGIEVVVAVREFEAWFLAALPSLSHHRALLDEVPVIEHPEARRGCKAQLETFMKEKYRESRHQEDFAAALDIRSAAANSRSFRHLVDATARLLTSSG